MGNMVYYVTFHWLFVQLVAEPAMYSWRWLSWVYWGWLQGRHVKLHVWINFLQLRRQGSCFQTIFNYGQQNFLVWSILWRYLTICASLVRTQSVISHKILTSNTSGKWGSLCTGPNFMALLSTQFSAHWNLSFFTEAVSTTKGMIPSEAEFT